MKRKKKTTFDCRQVDYYIFEEREKEIGRKGDMLHDVMNRSTREMAKGGKREGSWGCKF